MRARHLPTALIALTLVALSTSGVPEALAQLKTGAEKKNPKDGAAMVYCAPAEFTMGADDGFQNEKPARKVKLTKGFWIYKTEVTNAMYGKFLAANPKVAKPKYWTNPRFKQADQPVVGVTWTDAAEYCKWAGGRLPTEAEWEYAARGADARPYPWGKEAPDATRTVFAQEEATGKPGGAGKLAPGASPCGALDMAGNVWEWCADWYQPVNANPAPDNAPGPATGIERVIRGGSWYQAPFFLRSTFRNRAAPDATSSEVGFRAAMNE